jgi:hypothetical protein
MLVANIKNSTTIDRSYERILDFIFYTLLAIVILFLLGIDALSPVLSLASLVVAFGFVVGPASR